MKRIIITVAIFVACSNISHAQWTALTGTTGTLRSVYFPDDETGYCVGLNGHIIKTEDAGETWTSQASGTTDDLYTVFFYDANTGWAAGEYGTIVYTNNGGATWTEQTNDVARDIKDIHFTSATTGYLVGEEGTILKTFNGGGTWLEVESGINSSLNSIYFTDPNTAYIAGSSGHILKMVIDGYNISFTYKSLGTSKSFYSVACTSAGIIYFLDINGSVTMTYSGFFSFSSSLTGSDENHYSIFFCTPDTGYIVGAQGIIFVTTNGGNNWSAESSGTTSALYSVFFTESGKGYVCGASGTVLKKEIVTTFPEISTHEKTINIYPNPARNIISLHIDNSEYGNFTARIFAMTGETVYSGNFNSSLHNIDVSFLGNGLYILEIKTTLWSERQKLIIKK